MASISTIKNRRDFLAAADKGKKCVTGSFVLQALARPASHPAGSEATRVGYTVTKKIGNSPERNLAKRRLREAFRKTAPERAEAGYDYVLIARHRALECDFSQLLRDMEFAFSQITGKKGVPSKP